MKQNDFNRELKSLLREFSKDSSKFIMQLKKDDPGAELFKYTNDIICTCTPGLVTRVAKNTHNPFLYTTENLEYITCATGGTAFTILGAGDPVFELLARDVKDITACEVNPLQIAVYNLRVTALKTLNKNAFIRFLVDFNHGDFLQTGVFNRVRKNFSPEEIEMYNYWSNFISFFEKDDVKEIYFRLYDKQNAMYKKQIVNKLVNGLYWLNDYDKVKENLNTANINIIKEDAVTYLSNNNYKYDYIDLTNIILFAYQASCQSDLYKLQQYLEKIKCIFNNNLNNGGIMAIDYVFRSNIENLIKGNNSDNLMSELYTYVYNYFNSNLNIELKQEKSICALDNYNEINDVVMLAKK